MHNAWPAYVHCVRMGWTGWGEWAGERVQSNTSNLAVASVTSSAGNCAVRHSEKVQVQLL